MAKHLPGIARGLTMAAVVVLVAILVKTFERPPARAPSPPPDNTSPATPEPLPADTALVQPEQTELPTVTFICHSLSEDSHFPSAELLGSLLAENPRAFVIRVEKAPSTPDDDGKSGTLAPPVVVITNADQSRQRVLHPPINVEEVLAAVADMGADAGVQTDEQTAPTPQRPEGGK